MDRDGGGAAEEGTAVGGKWTLILGASERDTVVHLIIRRTTNRREMIERDLLKKERYLEGAALGH